jgi:hypothetical protein
MRAFSPHRVLAVPALCFCLATAAHADWIRDFSIRGIYNDNVSNSNRDADKLDDFAFDTSIRLGKFAELSSALKFAFTLDFDSRQWVNYSDLDNFQAGATASLRYRFGLGAMAPFLRLEAGAHYVGFNQDLQDGGRYRVALVAGKRLTERWDAQVSFLFDAADTRSRLYTQTGLGFSVHTSFNLTSSTQLTADYTFRHGDVISYAVPPRTDLTALANDRAIVTTFGTPYLAYNMDATTNTLAFGVNQALTRSLGFSVRYELSETSRSKLHYTNNVVLATWQLSF